MVQPRDSEVGDCVATSDFSKLYPASSSRLVCSFLPSPLTFGCSGLDSIKKARTRRSTLSLRARSGLR